ncbi:acyl-CoA dehydrogenase family protein [Agreia sp. COWG]|uniref:acyl-CoA dehydrogenase family protein n=1 Tax=Agreia sp. COWG TaxID=2773266 RepID=UPI0019254369|nr:acyl-CoA dehydrogenase family protein [Agreia sp. COWG]CAD6006201.1 putative Dibenzothiophene desulfurization enzyme C [Agreia sp. COWG]
MISTEAAALDAAELLAERFAADAVRADAEGRAPFEQIAAFRASGLLPALVPARLGGGGLDWHTVLRALRPIVRADAGLGHVIAYHFVNSWRLQLNENRHAVDDLYRGLVSNSWFWGGAGNPRDAGLELTPTPDGFTVSGRKFFATGAQLADRVTASGTRVDTGERLAIVIDAKSAGVLHHDDWSNIGQRLSASGSVSFTNVAVPHSHVLGPNEQDGELYRPFGSLSILAFQLVLNHLHVGIAEGALAEAASYARTTTRPWATSGVDRATDDPYIRQSIGELTAETRAADALTWSATNLFVDAASAGAELGDDERGRAAVEIAAAKVVTTRTALHVASTAFELMGARSTSGSAGMDRFWRNARTLTLHDPVVYKAQEVGDFALTGAFPTPSAYS